MLRFLIFVSFCWFFELHTKYGKNLENLVKKVEFFALFGMKLKKSAENRKNEKTQHIKGCFKSNKEFKIIFLNFCLLLADFEQKVVKNVFFVVFSKTMSFGQNLTLPMCSSWNSLSENVYFHVLLWIC